jgi:hypothetical protein
MKKQTANIQEQSERIGRLSDNDMRVLFRAIVADEWQYFEPQPPQVGTKVMVREYTHRLMTWMKEYVPNAKPNHFDDEVSYQVVWESCRAWEKSDKRMLLYVIVRALLERHAVVNPKKSLIEFDLAKLNAAMQVLAQQHAANQTGWRYTGEYVHIERKKREKRA